MKLRQTGFTIIELIIALAMFALISVMAYGGLNSMLKSEAQLASHSERFGKLQRTLFYLHEDLMQLVARPIRDSYGERQAPLQSRDMGSPSLEFTRAGWSNPARQSRSTLQRVGYGLEDDRLTRYSWQILDRSYESEALTGELLSGVKAFDLRFLDSEGVWQQSWPPYDPQVVDATQAALYAPLPQAVEVTLTLSDGTLYQRIIRTVSAAW
ncbi:MAG: type II secretion system minor pseudopilin GspJ [Gammaproteobacteria bacterium]|nr:type II secretion system minor pseudopilin GspJ [Gammaproteobacteria bacterium]